MLNFKGLSKLILGVVIAVFFLYFAFKGIDWNVFLNVFLNVNYLYIFLMLFFLLFSHLLRALRWKYLLKPVKLDTSFIHFFEATMIGYFFNNIFPRAGEVFKAYSLSSDEKISSASSLASVLLERILDIAFSLFFFGVAMLWNKKIFEKHYPWLGQAALFSGLIVGIIFVLILIFLIWQDRFVSLLGRFVGIFNRRLAVRFKNVLNSFINGFEAIRHRGVHWRIILLSFLIYLCYIFAAYVALFAFEIERAKIGFFTALVIFVVSTVGFIIPTPGGVGSYHSLITGALVGLYSIKHEVALGYAVLTHGVGYIVNGLLGFYFAMRKHIKFSIGLELKGAKYDS
ncbi:MAG: lysylphosphatidylglycerol synthase transmembrane domain-containing protein [Candidatus Kryptonium sp.]